MRGLGRSECALCGSPTIRSARNAPAIGVTATVLGFGLRRVEVTSPSVEFVAKGVEPPAMIGGVEVSPFGH